MSAAALDRLWRGVQLSLNLLTGWVALSAGRTAGLQLLRISPQQAAALWSLERQTGKTRQLVFAPVDPVGWPDQARLQAILYLRQRCRLRPGEDLRRHIWQLREIIVLENDRHRTQSLWSVAWRLWREEVWQPALQLVGLSGGRAMPACRPVAIIGWYGTETLGDAAILGEILFCLQEQGFADSEIAVYGSAAKRTALTLAELARPRVESCELVDLLGSPTDMPSLLIFGGGPLCDGRAMTELARLLAKPASAGCRVFLWGVGVGPLHEPRYRQAIAAILRRADKIAFRDDASRRLAETLAPEIRQAALAVLPDPAAGYLRRFMSARRTSEPPYCLAAVRSWPRLAGQGLTDDEFARQKKSYDERWREVLADIAGRGLAVRLIAHEYWPEEDRDYFAALLDALPDNSRLSVIEPMLTVNEALQWYAQAEVVLAGRFHAAVFALALNKPFLAVDYIWSGGKTTALLAQVGLQQRGLALAEFLAMDAAAAVTLLLAPPPDWRPVNEELQAGLAGYGRFFFAGVKQDGSLP